MWMVLPDQAGSLQGSRSVSCDLLAANDLGIGSGWQQSKQNWTLLAVVGYWIRMACSDLFCAEGAPLQPFLFFDRIKALFLKKCEVAISKYSVALGLSPVLG